MEPYADTVAQYLDFARQARDSPCFVAWSRGVAEDEEVLARLAALPPVKQQPNLVFAAARWHGTPAPSEYDVLRRALLGAGPGAGLVEGSPLWRTILSRSTQTNEVGRLATLVPAFAAVAGSEPIALLEVGASAGLCLYPDAYSYAWTTSAGDRTAGSGPLLSAETDGPAPLPDRVPPVAWREGVDLNPLDVTDADQMRWLTTLVWPEQEERRARLERAIAIARDDPPRICRGDLLVELPDLVERAAEHGPVVVFHTAVIAYLEPADRARFHDLMSGLVAAGRCHWVSNEAAGVLPAVTATGPEPPAGYSGFVLGIDARAVAWTHGHGRWLRWHG